MTRTDIAAVLDKLPLLNDHGNGLYLDGWHLTPRQRRATLAEGREQLLGKADECARACKWLGIAERIKTINPRHTSYGYKRMAEKACGGPISNGAFIVAAIHMGFTFQAIRNSSNFLFGISEKSVKR